jgi:3-polyprenyl-4-hydroxybenzoate decarboxylase
MMQVDSDILHLLSLDSAVVEALVKRVHDERDESTFEGLRKDVLNTAEKCNVETEPTPNGKTKRID